MVARMCYELQPHASWASSLASSVARYHLVSPASSRLVSQKSNLLYNSGSVGPASAAGRGWLSVQLANQAARQPECGGTRLAEGQFTQLLGGGLLCYVVPANLPAVIAAPTHMWRIGSLLQLHQASYTHINSALVLRVGFHHRPGCRNRVTGLLIWHASLERPIFSN